MRWLFDVEMYILASLGLWAALTLLTKKKK